MKKVSFMIMLCLLLACSGKAKNDKVQQIPLPEWSVEDAVIFQNLGTNQRPIIAWAKSFLGTPYVGKTLEVGNDSVCVINLRELDCTTYVENMVALALLDTLTQDDFARQLTALRYRNGEPKGYASRLNYTSEWIADNVKAGFVRDITEELGGKPQQTHIDFMTTHRKFYPNLKSEENFQQIKATEKRLQEQRYFVIPKEELGASESLIQDGDIIALATTIEGLDFVHLGFALWNKEAGKLHFLHASSVQKKIMITEKTLVEYVQGRSDTFGVAVLRINKE